MIKLLSRPVRPHQLEINVKYDIYENDTVLEVLNNIPPEYRENARFDCEWVEGYGSDHKDWFISCSYPESDEDYNKRLEQYEIDLKEYNQWEKDNAAAILEIKQSSEKKQLDKIRKEKKQLEKQLNTLSKKERNLLERK